jgi:hypothetical protein
MGHTPGPWGLDGTGSIYSDALPRSACLVANLESDSDDWAADGALISAAPDLLAAARLANQELLDLGQGSSASPALRALWMAIAKAEGRSE